MTHRARQFTRPVAGAAVRTVRGVLVGASLLALVVAARHTGVMTGRSALLVAGIGTLCIPVSRTLSRRILILGVSALGWLPMFWWLPSPFPSVGRVTILLALMFGGLGAWVASGAAPRRRLSQLCPRVQMVDAFPVLTAIVGAVALRDFLGARTGVRVLTLLIAGWDHSAHYTMVELVRKYQVVTFVAPKVTLGGPTSYTGYPQGYHAMAAATMELLTSPTVRQPDAELVLYAHSMAITILFAVTVVTAGICALPALRRRPSVAAPLVAVVTAAFMFGPGVTALINGFPNFVLCCAILATIPLLVVPLERVVNPIVLVALGGAIVGVAHTWALLLVPAALAALPLILPISQHRWRASRGRWTMTVGIVLAVVVSLVCAFRVLKSVTLSAQLVTPGGVTPPAIGLLLTILLGSAGLALALQTSGRTNSHRTRRGSIRSAGFIIVPVGGSLSAAAIVILQMRATHVIGYYFWKYIIALELLCIVVLIIVAVAFITSRPLTRHTFSGRIVAATSSLVLILAASQAFGYAGPSLAAYAVWQGDSTTQSREAMTKQAEISNPMAERLLAAVHVQEYDLTREVVFLPYPADQRTHPLSAEQWYQALTGTWNDTRAAVVHSLGCLGSSVEDAGACSTTILLADPSRIITVGPDVVDSVRAAADSSVRERIVAW